MAIMSDECYKIIKDGKPLNDKDYSAIKEQIKVFEQGLKSHKKDKEYYDNTPHWQYDYLDFEYQTFMAENVEIELEVLKKVIKNNNKGNLFKELNDNIEKLNSCYYG